MATEILSSRNKKLIARGNKTASKRHSKYTERRAEGDDFYVGAACTVP